MGRGGRKEPKTAKGFPQGGKTPKTQFTGREYLDKKFRWNTPQIALTGRWGFQTCDHARLFSEIIPKLQSFETMTWREITVNDVTGSHEIAFDRMIAEAQARVNEILGGDVDMFSLRITGRRRIFGLRTDNTLSIILDDPEHEICPGAEESKLDSHYTIKAAELLPLREANTPLSYPYCSNSSERPHRGGSLVLRSEVRFRETYCRRCKGEDAETSGGCLKPTHSSK